MYAALEMEKFTKAEPLVIQPFTAVPNKSGCPTNHTPYISVSQSDESGIIQ
jgi:hypothetical protein